MKNEPGRELGGLLPPLLIVLGTGLAAAAFLDLHFARALYEPGAGWAVLIEKYGEIPGLLTAVLALALLTPVVSALRPAARWALRLPLFLAAALLLEYIAALAVCGAQGLRASLQIAVFAAAHGTALRTVPACLALALLAAGPRLAARYGARATVFARAALQQLAVSQLLVQAFKVLWGRVRFRDLGPGFAGFSPWCRPYSGAGGSFPSGHTALAWLLLPLCLLAPAGSRARRTLFAAACCWGLLVACGRMATGAHYLSDTLAATLFSAVPFLLLARRERL